MFFSPYRLIVDAEVFYEFVVLSLRSARERTK